MRVLLALLLAFAALPAWAQSDKEVYALYRNSVMDQSSIHVATFDTVEGANYNAENCNLAADLFQQQEGVQTRFWCEQGRFHQ